MNAPPIDEVACRVCGCTWVPNPLGVDLCSTCVYAITQLVVGEEPQLWIDPAEAREWASRLVAEADAYEVIEGGA